MKSLKLRASAVQGSEHWVLLFQTTTPFFVFTENFLQCWAWHAALREGAYNQLNRLENKQNDR
jgi:hypothetical protein